MKEIADRNLPLNHEQMPKAEARKLYKNNPYKLELIDDIPGDTVGIARQGDFYDLCRGGHVDTTGLLKNVKLQEFQAPIGARTIKASIATDQWRCLLYQQDMDAWEKAREEAAKYDHRRLGKQLDLFSFHDEGVGFPFFHPKGKLVLNLMTLFMRKLQQDMTTKKLAVRKCSLMKLWKTSGHYAHYKDNMYFCLIDDQSYAVRPMNCPGSILIYKTRPRSYRELPLKLARIWIGVPS